MKRILLAGLFATIAIIPSTSFAVNYGEKESLSKLLHELNAIRAIVDEAESRANPADRINFEYNALKSDLAKIRFGIREHMETPTVEPRKYAPLGGDYAN